MPASTHRALPGCENFEGEPERCGYCGCALRFLTRAYQVTAATREEERAVIQQLRASGGFDGQRYRTAMAPYGKREVWFLRFECPGCEASGTHLGTEFTQDEAGALVAEKNHRAETRSQPDEALHWRARVRHRAEVEAHRFRQQLLARWPEWERYLEPVPEFAPGTEGDADTRQVDMALRLRVPSENPAVSKPLLVEVRSRESILHWGDFWHQHEPPERIMESLAALVEERLITVHRYRGETCVSGGTLHPGMELPEPYFRMEPNSPGWADRIQLRSWRGTHDRLLRLDGANRVLSDSARP